MILQGLICLCQANKQPWSLQETSHMVGKGSVTLSKCFLRMNMRRMVRYGSRICLEIRRGNRPVNVFGLRNNCSTMWFGVKKNNKRGWGYRFSNNAFNKLNYVLTVKMCPLYLAGSVGDRSPSMAIIVYFSAEPCVRNDSSNSLLLLLSESFLPFILHLK